MESNFYKTSVLFHSIEKDEKLGIWDGLKLK